MSAVIKLPGVWTMDTLEAGIRMAMGCVAKQKGFGLYAEQPVWKMLRMEGMRTKTANMMVKRDEEASDASEGSRG